MRQDFEKYAAEVESGLKADASEIKNPGLNTISAATLQKAYLPPVQFVVQGLIPHGLTLLAAPPKFGKSWLALDLALSVAAGGKFLGYSTNPSEVLYLALEDSENRLKTRMEKILGGRPAPAGADFCTGCPTLDGGLLGTLNDYCTEHPATRLIIVDTLQKVRGIPSNSKENGYSSDYREMSALKKFADSRGVAVLLVHHLRKMLADGDPFDRISGTNGIFGVADTAIVLTREKRADKVTKMTVTGRDIDAAEQILQFNKDSCRWENLGGADWYAEKLERDKYNDAPIVKTIKRLLMESPTGWTGTSSELIERGHIPATSPQALGKEIQRFSIPLLENDGISYAPVRNGSGGMRHRFVFINENR